MSEPTEAMIEAGAGVLGVLRSAGMLYPLADERNVKQIHRAMEAAKPGPDPTQLDQAMQADEMLASIPKGGHGG